MIDGQNNFAGLQDDFFSYGNSKIVILPISFDKTSSWIKGSDKGPEAIIEASKNMELYDIETDSEVFKQGIFTDKKIISENSKMMIGEVYNRTKQLLQDKKFVVVLGGEHSVSLGAIKSYAEHFPILSVLHLDAHSDRRDSYEGNKYSHACVIARVEEIVENIVSVGIRSMDSSELGKLDKDKIFYAKEIYNSESWVDKVVSKLSENVYVTIDLDVFDPGIMPSTGTPEPGGLSWYSVLKLLKKVFERRNVVGFDVVELCPSLYKAPDFLAAKLIYKLLSYKFS